MSPKCKNLINPRERYITCAILPDMKYILILAIIGLITVAFLSGFAFRVMRSELKKRWS